MLFFQRNVNLIISLIWIPSLIKSIPINESQELHHHQSRQISADFQDEYILKKIMTGYDKRVRPATSLEEDDTSGPVIVYVNYMIRMIFGINVKDNEYSMQITFREKWYDPRLAYDKYFAKNMPEFITVPHIRKQIWSPDTFFMTEKKAHGHAIDTENMFIRIYANGSVYYSTRLSMIISCPFMLHYYPMDTQFCDSDMGSYAHTATDIEYQWDDSVASPIQIKSGVDQSLPNFLLVNYTVNRDCTHKTLTGVYSCLRLRLKLSRQFSYYLVQLYGPTAMIVVASWVSFWIDISSSAGRVSLSVMTLLTMTTLQSSINSKLPPVSYVKIVDIWLLSCQAFVFGALVEYAFVSYQDNKLKGKLAKKEELRKRQNRKGDEIHYEMPIGEGYFYQPQCTCSHNYTITTPHPRESIFARFQRRYFKKPDDFAAKIDFYARWFFPLCFLLFNLMYWGFCYYVTQESD